MSITKCVNNKTMHHCVSFYCMQLYSLLQWSTQSRIIRARPDTDTNGCILLDDNFRHRLTWKTMERDRRKRIYGIHFRASMKERLYPMGICVPLKTSRVHDTEVCRAVILRTSKGFYRTKRRLEVIF